MTNYLLYIIAFSMTFGITLYMTPAVKKFAIKAGAISYPKSRGMHSEPMPQMGGLAIVIGFMATMLVLTLFVSDFRTSLFAGFMAGACIIVLLGMLDDIYILNPKLKLVVQIVAALVVVFTGTRMNVSFLPLHGITKNLEIPLTLIWIVGLTNAFNWIDGLDGLAAGVSSICSICLMILCIISNQEIAVIFAAALARSCFGFLPRNFNPAEIIMGDTGSMFLGYTLAVSSIIGVYKNYALLSVVLAVLALAFPILDMTTSVFRRVKNRKSPLAADRGHLHHKLVDSGFSPKQAVVLLYALSAVAGCVAIFIAMKDYRSLLVILFFLFIFLLMTFFYRKRIQKSGDEDK